jgi:hypothetical protein
MYFLLQDTDTLRLASWRGVVAAPTSTSFEATRRFGVSVFVSMLTIVPSRDDTSQVERYLIKEKET